MFVLTLRDYDTIYKTLVFSISLYVNGDLLNGHLSLLCTCIVYSVLRYTWDPLVCTSRDLRLCISFNERVSLLPVPVSEALFPSISVRQSEEFGL